MADNPFPIGGETRDEEAERLRLSKAWQSVMRTDDGRLVLGSILRDLGLFTPIMGERAAARHGAALAIMEQMQSYNDKLCLMIISELLTNDRASDE